MSSSANKKQKEKISKQSHSSHVQEDGAVHLPSQRIETSTNSSDLSQQVEPKNDPKDSSSRKRKPRKLAARPQNNTKSSTPSIPEGVVPDPLDDTEQDPGVLTDISRLKTRVGEIETRVNTLLAGSGNTNTNTNANMKGRVKVSRRRTPKGGVTLLESEGVRNGVSDGDTAGEGIDHKTQAQTQLRGQSKGKSSKSSASSLRTPRENQSSRQTTRNETDNDKDNTENESNVEEIQRHPPSPTERSSSKTKSQRAITISQQYKYKLPLPDSVTDQDLQNVQNGIKGVQSIARRYVESRRRREQYSDIAEQSVGDNARGGEGDGEGEGPVGWGGWWGGYTLSVARFVAGVDTEGFGRGGESGEAEGLEGRRRVVRRNTEPVGGFEMRDQSQGQGQGQGQNQGQVVVRGGSGSGKQKRPVKLRVNDKNLEKDNEPNDKEKVKEIVDQDAVRGLLE